MAQPWEGEGLKRQHGNPSSSHASGAGPFFSLWEKSPYAGWPTFLVPAMAGREGSMVKRTGM
jgi:hypothetical protein